MAGRGGVVQADAVDHPDGSLQNLFAALVVIDDLRHQVPSALRRRTECKTRAEARRATVGEPRPLCSATAARSPSVSNAGVPEAPGSQVDVANPFGETGVLDGLGQRSRAADRAVVAHEDGAVTPGDGSAHRLGQLVGSEQQIRDGRMRPPSRSRL